MAHPADDGLSIFTTMRYDATLRDNAENTIACGGTPSCIYMLTAHFDRLSEAAAALMEAYPTQGLDWLQNLQHPKQIEQACDDCLQALLDTDTSDDAALRLRVWRMNLSLQADGTIQMKAVHTPAMPPPLLFPQSLDNNGEPSWTVVIGPQPTRIDVNSCFKTSDRTAYNLARQVANITSPAVCKEILLYNASGLIMDCSITTPYFWRGDRWVTPSVTAGGQRGVTRRWALAQGLCFEGAILKSSLRAGEVIWLSNALRGFFPAMCIGDQSQLET